MPADVSLAAAAGVYNTNPYVVANLAALAAAASVSVPTQFNGPFPGSITFGAEVYFGPHVP